MSLIEVTYGTSSVLFNMIRNFVNLTNIHIMGEFFASLKKY